MFYKEISLLIFMKNYFQFLFSVLVIIKFSHYCELWSVQIQVIVQLEEICGTPLTDITDMCVAIMESILDREKKNCLSESVSSDVAIPAAFLQIWRLSVNFLLLCLIYKLLYFRN